MVKQNPYGKVPVLINDNGVIFESAVINEYLDEKFPQIRLMPSDFLKRSKVRIWVDFMNTRVHPTGSDLQKDREPGKARVRMDQHLRALDDALIGQDYLVGEYSLADVTFIPFYTRRERYKVAIDDNYPNLRRWAESLIARPQVAKTL
ncbi:MAG: glutathione S-transferase family protein [Deltaproteobacteria bacterium]|nr:glutathione S-transferase family protein [Deltaproteobacteria bacterium]